MLPTPWYSHARNRFSTLAAAFLALVTVSVVGVAAPAAAATASSAPAGVAVTAGESSLWVHWAAPASDGGSAITGYTVSVKDGATLVGTYPAGPATTGRTIGNLTNGTTYTVTVTATNGIGTSAPSASATGTPVDARTPNTQTATIPVGNGPFGVAISPDGTTAYVTNYTVHDTVSVINTSTNAVTDTITGFNSPYGVAISPDGTTAYVTNHSIRHRQRHRHRHQHRHRHHHRGHRPHGCGGQPRRHHRLRHQQRSGTVSVINTATHTVTTPSPWAAAR